MSEEEKDPLESWLRLLSKRSGQPHEKRKWLEDNLELIEAEAEASFGDIEPTQRALNGRIKSLIYRWYRHQSRGGQGVQARSLPAISHMTEEELADWKVREQKASVLARERRLQREKDGLTKHGGSLRAAPEFVKALYEKVKREH